jgi:hopanoid biosynthesis associated RND transporter like protein HpnN
MSRFLDALVAWVTLVCRNPRLTLAMIIGLTVVSGIYAWQNFRINSDLSGLIDQTSSWRVHFDDYESAFPDQLRTVAVVVYGDSFGAVESAAKTIEAAIRAQPEFVAISAPQNLDFLRDRALLYLSIDDLDEMAERLADAQPVLTAIAEDPSLRGVLEVLGDAVDNADDAEQFRTILELVEKSGAQKLQGEPASIAWTDELFSPDPPQIRVITFKGKPDFGVSLPSAELLRRLDAVLEKVQKPAGVEIGVTGEIALTHEEMQAATSGVNLAGWISVAFLALVMIVGVRSITIVLTSLLMLLIGVILTTAFALTTVGEFNTLSLVFIVTFFGLGVDYALHYSLRYQESINQQEGIAAALIHAARGVGDAITLCALTTVLGFLAFWPTRYGGLADLGVISAAGMVIALWLTFTLLPAIYVLAGPVRPHSLELPSSEVLVRRLIDRRRVVITVVALLAAAALAVSVTRVHFDYSVLALRDENVESMRMLRFLQKEGVATDYALYVVHEPGALDVSALEALPMVDSVLTPDDYVPKDQEEKIPVIEELNLLLESALYPLEVAVEPDVATLREAISAFARQLETKDAGQPEVWRQLRELPDEVLLAWQDDVVVPLQKELGWLSRALSTEPVVFEELPADLEHRLVAADGRQLSVITPKEDITGARALGEFITSVHTIAPTATGRPVIEKGVGEIVIGAFVQATLTAAIGVLIILLLVFRSLKDALLITLPLVLAALFTLSVGELMGAPLNMANILVLPLIFGLGVDNGIHVFHRYRQGGDVDGLMHSSTPRAVFLSTLTTVGAFASLMLSPHVGTASIGVYLTLAMGLILLFAIFLLPVLLKSAR